MVKLPLLLPKDSPETLAQKLEAAFGWSIRDKGNLTKLLDGDIMVYRRMHFIGSGALQALLAHKLFDDFADANEATLTEGLRQSRQSGEISQALGGLKLEDVPKKAGQERRADLFKVLLGTAYVDAIQAGGQAAFLHSARLYIDKELALDPGQLQRITQTSGTTLPLEGLQKLLNNPQIRQAGYTIQVEAGYIAVGETKQHAARICLLQVNQELHREEVLACDVPASPKHVCALNMMLWMADNTPIKEQVQKVLSQTRWSGRMGFGS